MSLLSRNHLGEILACFENWDPAGLSEELGTGFIPLFRKTLKLFSEVIIPFLKEKTEQKAAEEKTNA